MKTFMFGSREDIRTALVNAAILPENDFLRVIDRFASMVADRNLNAHGVNLSFQMAVHGVATERGAVPFLSGMVNSEFPDLMAAVIDDPDFLKAVTDIHDDILDAVGKG